MKTPIEKFAETVRVKHQGKFVVEKHEEGFFCMTPDGDVWAFGSKRDVERHVKQWCKDHLVSDIGVAEIEWRL